MNQINSNVWKTLRGLLAVALVFAGFLNPMQHHEAKAEAQSELKINVVYMYEWTLTFNFEDSYNGTLHVEVGHENGGVLQKPAVHTKDHKVPCQPVGAVSLASGAAILQGGYLQCDFDLKSALETTFAECQLIEAGCTMIIPNVESYPNVRMAAQVFSTSEGEAPLFYHEDATYTISPTTKNLSLSAFLGNIGTMSTTPVTVPEITPPGTLSNWQTYTSRYMCEVGCNMHFGISGAAQTLPLGGDGPVEFLTTSTRIFIGRNDATGLIAPSATAIAYLTIDPPKFGNN